MTTSSPPSRNAPQFRLAQLRIRINRRHVIVLAPRRRDILNPQSPRRVIAILVQRLPVPTHLALVVGRVAALELSVDVGHDLRVGRAHDGVADGVEAVRYVARGPEGLVGPRVVVGEFFGEDEL